MARGRSKSGGRREPRFEGGFSLSDFHLSADDRPAPGSKRAAQGARSSRKPQYDEEPEPSREPPQKRRDKTQRGKKRSGIGRLIYWGVVASLWLVIAIVGIVIWVGAHLPAIQSLEIPKRPPTVHIVGLDGTEIAARGEMAGSNVPIGALPPYLPQAFIAIEDRRFYSHFGVDPAGIARAFAANIMRRGVSQGGSTLTQQLAKNLFLTQERTMSRKLAEVELALWLERKYTKQQILELYLNRVYFGSGAYGVEAAAQKYFGKSARAVTLAEAAMLAGLVKSPSRLAPNRNPDGAQTRARLVIAAMADMKFVTEKQAKIASEKPAESVRPQGAGTINYVADWIMEVLDDLVGPLEQDVIVETSLDPKLQAIAETAIIDELAAKSGKFNVSQGALVAMTPQGAVRALIGGRNYAESQFNRATAAKRQPGSAFKPFVYLAALERGLRPDSVRLDGPINVKGWKPENYTHEYFGQVTLAQALSMSLNTVAVRLALEVGPQSVMRTAYRLGISSKLEPNASLALGTSEVSLMELTGAYAPLANGGMKVSPHVVERVRTQEGKILYARSGETLGRVIEPAYVAMMNLMMQETLLSGTARKAEIPGWPAAGKTGTTQDFRDAWFIGYTGHLITGVWLGTDDNSPTRKTTGGGLPVEVWTRFMRAAHQSVPVAALPGSEGGAFNVPMAGSGDTPPNASDMMQAGGAQAQRGSQPSGSGLDTWLIDRLFGRR